VRWINGPSRLLSYAGFSDAAAPIASRAPPRKDVPSYRIQLHTRHKSAEMVARYIREADS